MRKNIIVLAAFCLLIANQVLAQKKKYALEEVWQKVIEYYPTLSSKKALAERQEFTRELAKQQALPRVNLQAQQSYGTYQSVPGAFFPLPGLYNTSGSNQNGTTSEGANLFASAVLKWDFMQFGRIEKKVDAATAGIELGKADISLEAYQLQALSTRYYFDILHNLSVLNLYRSDEKRLSELSDLLKAQADAGLLPGADTLLIKSSLLQTGSEINERQSMLETSIYKLAALMGEDPAALSVDSSLYFNYTPDGLSLTDKAQHHPYLQYLNAGIDLQKAELEVIRKEPYPSVGLLAGTSIRGSGIETSGVINKSVMAPWNNSAGSYLIGVGITWDLSSLYENKTRRQMAEREIAASKATYDAASLQLNTGYASAIAGWKQQSFRVQNARTAFETSRQAYDLYTVRYESGLINLIELLQLQKTLQEAERSYVQSVYSYWRELILQSEALGNPSLIITAIKP